jgi:hypothetical protein
MAGRGPQSFKKRQKEQQRKEKQEAKMAKKIERRQQGPVGSSLDVDPETYLQNRIDNSEDSELDRDVTS